MHILGYYTYFEASIGEEKRTMYSWGARYSTDPWVSSGWLARSWRWPLASSAQKYSMGTSENMPQTLHWNRLRRVHVPNPLKFLTR